MTTVLLVWAVAVAVVSLVAIIRRARMSARVGAAEPNATTADACLLRPCAGAEAGLAKRLGGGPVIRTRLTVAHADDTALPAIRAAAAQLRDRGADATAAVVAARGPNLKVGQLAEADDDVSVWICADSDVDLAQVDLGPLLAPILRGQVAATWMAPAEVGGTTLADRASAAFLNGSLHSFHLLGALDPHGLVGKVFAVDATALSRIGGFAAFRDRLGEDMAIAQALREQGLRSAFVAGCAPAVVSGRRFPAVIERYGRWLAVIRAQRPALLLSYPLLFGATTPIVLWSCLASAWGAVSVALGARLAVALAARHWAGGPASAALFDVPLGECVTWAAFVRAASRRTVTWRGRRLRLDRAGRVQALDAPPDG